MYYVQNTTLFVKTIKITKKIYKFKHSIQFNAGNNKKAT